MVACVDVAAACSLDPDECHFVQLEHLYVHREGEDGDGEAENGLEDERAECGGGRDPLQGVFD